MAYIGRQLVRGQNRIYDDISSSFNGSTTTFNLTIGGDATPPAQVNQLWIILGGILQKPGTDFTVADAQVTFTTAPAAGLDFWAMIQGDTSDMNAPSDGSVTPTKIATSGDFAFPADVRFKDADGSHYVGLQAPTTVSSNLVWTLPAADGSANQILKTNGSGVLGWATDSATDSTKMPLAGGTFTGDVTFDGATAGRDIVWDKSDNALEFADNAKGIFGTGADFEVYHDATDNQIKSTNGKVVITTTSGNSDIEITPNGSGNVKLDGLAWPNADGSANQYLKTDGSGALSWSAVTSTTINSNTNNYLITGTGTADTLQGEAQLTFDGNTLTQTIDASAEGFNQTAAGDHVIRNIASSNRSGSGQAIFFQRASWNGNNVAELQFLTGDDTTNKDDGQIAFLTGASGTVSEKVRIDSSGQIGILTNSPSSWDANADDLVINGNGHTGITINSGSAGTTNLGNIVFAEGTAGSADRFRGVIQYKHGDDYMRFYTNNEERFRIKNDGDVSIDDGNLIVASGHGIDFSATAGPAAGSGTSELLDDYEEGTWTPDVKFNDVSASGQSSNGNYTKIGNVVFAMYQFTLTNKGTGDGQFHLNGFPFAPSTGYGDIASGMGYMHRFADTDNDSGQVYQQFYSSILYYAYRGLNGNTTRLTDDNFRNDTACSGMIVYRTNA